MKAISYLIKPASSLCNMRCGYCFYEDEAALRAQKSMGVMQSDTVKALLDETFRQVEPGGQVSFAFQGGEPTLAGLDFFTDFTRQARQNCPPGVRLYFSIQTNGQAIDESWAEFLAREKYLVGLSLDGTKELHDRNRLSAAGKGTWNGALRACELLRRRGCAVNALCVVTAQCARQPDKVYNSLKKLGFDYMQFIACKAPKGERAQRLPWVPDADSYGKFLCRLFDLWYRDWETGNYHSVRLFDDYIHVLLGDEASTCSTCGRCSAYYVVEADGSVYPCDFFALDEWRIGRFGEETLDAIAGSDAARRFMALDAQKPAECAECKWREVCGGGCKDDWLQTADGNHNLNCAAFKALLEYAMPRMRRIAAAEAAYIRQNK